MSISSSPSHADQVAAYFTPDCFRREYGRLVAWLSTRFTRMRLHRGDGGGEFGRDAGDSIQTAQDIAQDTLFAAMRSWPQQGLPENPSAWLTLVARNRALDLLRRDNRLTPMTEQELEVHSPQTEQPEVVFAGEIGDDLLRLLFACCHPAISRDAQLALTLQVVAGFSASEIARAFLADERTIAQRIVRAKKELREQSVNLEIPVGEALLERVEAVLRALYLIFNEGYLTAGGESLTRPELCHEAERLLRILLTHESIARHESLLPSAQALMALFQFQLARLPARIDSSGELLLLEEQDRRSHDKERISAGFHWLDRARHGKRMTAYHLEAVILSCHVRAVDLQQTDWGTILECYDALLAIAPSPVVQLNQIVAYSFPHGPRRGLEQLAALGEDPALQRFHLYHAVRGDLQRRLGQNNDARESFAAALRLTENAREKSFLSRRLESLA